MADNHHRRSPNNDRDIYSSTSRERQRNLRRPPHSNSNHTDANSGIPPNRKSAVKHTTNTSPQNKRSTAYHPKIEEIDRYNYVDRDLYSSSRKSKANRGRSIVPPSKKKHKGKKIILAIVCLIFTILVAIAIFIAVMISRINYQPVDTASYVQQPADAPTWDVISDQDITNILLLGVDRSEDGTVRRSDTMMLLSIDHKSKNLRMTSFLRDLFVEVPTIGKTKLNAAYGQGGAGLTMQTIENNFRVNIDHYIEIDFENFTNLIDAMGGIEIEMTQAEANYMSLWYRGEYGENINLREGMNHMNGKAALTFARIRKLDSDFGRTGRQRQVMIAIFDKFKTLNPIHMASVFYGYGQYITTDLSSGNILSLSTQASKILGYQVHTFHIPIEDLYTEIDYNLIPDLPATSAKLREFIYGTNNTAN